MEVKIAKIAGFCMGVRKAMDIALSCDQSILKPIYTIGPLIHNPSALDLLISKGIEILKDIPQTGHGTVIIRAHGVPPETKEQLKKTGFNIIDATCPRVIKVQMLVRHYARKGHSCIVIGDEGHPEVRGIMGYGADKAILASNEEELKKIDNLKDYIIVAQTTQDYERYEKWSDEITRGFPGGRVFHTICDSTHKRQKEAKRLANEVDMVVVVGGKKSANTRRLAEIVHESGKEVMAVEDERDLDLRQLKHFNKIGVTAGASTPDWVINRIVEKIDSIA
jgi:4-hydroxy-3-methylbut-2-enyl diphosphate reductase